MRPPPPALLSASPTSCSTPGPAGNCESDFPRRSASARHSRRDTTSPARSSSIPPAAGTTDSAPLVHPSRRLLRFRPVFSPLSQHHGQERQQPPQRRRVRDQIGCPVLLPRRRCPARPIVPKEPRHELVPAALPGEPGPPTAHSVEQPAHLFPFRRQRQAQETAPRLRVLREVGSPWIGHVVGIERVERRPLGLRPPGQGPADRHRRSMTLAVYGTLTRLGSLCGSGALPWHGSPASPGPLWINGSVAHRAWCTRHPLARSCCMV